MRMIREIGDSLTFDSLNRSLSISKIIRTGQCSIIYEAVTGTGEKFMVQEYHPKNAFCIEYDDNKNIILNTHEESYIRNYNAGLNKFHADFEAFPGEREFVFQNNTGYIITCVPFDGCSYNSVEETTLLNLFKRMKVLATTVNEYHAKQYLHMNIKPENIIVDTDHDNVDSMILVSCNPLLKKSELENTDMVFYTEGFCGLEQYLARRKDICDASDVCAIGKLLFFKLAGRTVKVNECRSWVTEFNYDRNQKIFNGVNPEVFAHIDELLHKSMNNVVRIRYSTMDDMISKIDEIISIIESTN